VELNQYQNFVKYTTSAESKGLSEFIERIVTLNVNVPLLLTASVGLASESGEFSEIVKKIIFQGKEYNADVHYHMLRELGDICWYLANAANALSVNLEEIVKMNVEKLQARYPEGFDVARSENRAKGDL